MIKKATQIKLDKSTLPDSNVRDARIPEFIFLSKENAACPKADVNVKEGDHVNIGQILGVRHNPSYDENIIATCSGTYRGLEKHYYRNGKQVNFLKIENDHEDSYDESVTERGDDEISAFSKEEIISVLKEHSIVGMGGASYPAWLKLSSENPINTVLINAVESDPSSNADSALMRADIDSVINGIKIVLRALDCHDAKICIKKKDQDLIDLCSGKISEGSEISVCPVKNFYPQGWEVALVKSALKIDIEDGKLPSDYGVVVLNVTTLAAIFKAVKYNLPVYERYVSVSGDGINIPSTLKVRIGTPVSSLIEDCGGYKGEADKILVLGGPMSGSAILKDDGVISKGVYSVYVADYKESREEVCIRCGSCVMSCPVNINPLDIMNTMKSMPVNKEKIKALEPLKCIECGLCSYACTCNINVTDYVKRAKVVAKLK